ncbi:hypothetical protein EF912_21015 [Streptomyces sp. WAC07061]|uniref:LppU/SCO3897 family protein n=1 Tax=Streptomyces sp. WAC07061 TaxID=2487410 RepID=UPI000F7A32BB|nr:hypothetical protein [Streptomyces sp. WAC07061]RSS51123.1 hypothetical protein EF912_21015 [Streptomyces sp. WAC07061]
MATPPPGYGAGPYGPYPPQQQVPQPGPYAAQPGPYAAPPGPYAAQPGSHPPPPGPYAPASAYPAQPGPSAPQPAYAVPPQGAGDGCRVCGCRPAAPATVRGHQGLLVVMRFLSLPGPFCRDCGTATYRRMSSDTLWQGWWGPLSVFITPFTLLLNLGPRAAFRRLAEPAGGFRPPLDPGKPLWRRPPALLLLVPALLVAVGVPALVVVGLLIREEAPPVLAVGQCVRNTGDWKDQDLVVTDCGSARAQFRVSKRLTTGAACAAGDFLSDPKYGGDGWTLNCLTPLR